MVKVILFIAAIVLFLLTALLILFGGADKTLLDVLLLFGLACLAGGHVVP
jgi:hypothetical protein